MMTLSWGQGHAGSCLAKLIPQVLAAAVRMPWDAYVFQGPVAFDHIDVTGMRTPAASTCGMTVGCLWGNPWFLGPLSHRGSSVSPQTCVSKASLNVSRGPPVVQIDLCLLDPATTPRCKPHMAWWCPAVLSRLASVCSAAAACVLIVS
jgi:hypothetical protein